jgi:hypothetical protein
MSLSAIAGVIVAATIMLLSVVVDNLESFAFGHAIHNMFISSGLAFSAPFGYATCPLFRQLFGWNGTGGAYMQMLLISFFAWALIFSAAANLLFGRWKPKQT